MRLPTFLPVLLLSVSLWAGPEIMISRTADAFTATVNIPSVCGGNCTQIDVTRHGIKPNDGINDSPRLNQLIKAQGRNVVFYFPKGRYDLASAVRRDGLENVVFQGETGAELKKTTNFKDEYMLYTRFSKGVAVRNLIFKGKTTDRTKYNWGESGVYLASSDGVLVEGNNFYDFGDAAIRITTSQGGAKGVRSSNATVRNNYFENVTQVTTTSNANQFGGTNGFLMEKNVFKNLKGSVKFATRTAGAGQVILRNNNISGVPSLPTSVGVEISSYSNVFVENNLISDCGGFGMNIYTNPAPDIQGFDWGNYLIRNNTITRCAKGIRVSAQPYRDGYVPKVSTVTIENNTLKVAAGKTIQLVNGTIRDAVMRGNR